MNANGPVKDRFSQVSDELIISIFLGLVEMKSGFQVSR